MLHFNKINAIHIPIHLSFTLHSTIKFIEIIRYLSNGYPISPSIILHANSAMRCIGYYPSQRYLVSPITKVAV